MRSEIDPGVVAAEFSRRLTDDRLECRLCPRHCTMRDGQRGFCFVREVRDDRLVLSSYGKSTGFCVDPIEKKPLNHFYPGTSVLSFGTAGCNLGCRYCQNHEISKARADSLLSASASPEVIARAALEYGCRSVAFTYNDPVVYYEYVDDVASACRALGIKTVAVTAGYLTPEARPKFFENIDAANVDLKAFAPEFYRELCAAEIDPVLDTLRYLRHETEVWFEVTTLLIPGRNDGVAEIEALCRWYVETLGPGVPLHFSAFHPDHRMRDTPKTEPESLWRARKIALAAGVSHVYTGNIRDSHGQSTYCAGCGALVIERDWYELADYALDQEGRCLSCGTQLSGRLDRAPGNWGRKRMPIVMAGP